MRKLFFISIVLCLGNTMLLAQNAFWNADSIRSAEAIKLIKSGVQICMKFTIIGSGRSERTEESYDSTLYSASGDSIVETSYFVFKGKYPKLVERAVYSTDGKSRYYHSYSRSFSLSDQMILYDNKGNRLREYARDKHTSNDNNKDSLYLKELHEYDSSGNELSRVVFDANGHISDKVIYHYRDGHVEEVLNYSTMDYANMPDSLDFSEMKEWRKKQELKYTGRSISKVDSIARTIETDTYDNSDSNLFLIIVSNFNEHWNLLRHDVFSFEGRHFYYIVSYNEAGWQTEEKFYSNDTLTGVESFKYDDHGKLTLSSKMENGLETSRKEQKYDSLENIIEEVQIDQNNPSDKKLRKHDRRTTWDYDSRGNIIEQIEYLSGDPIRTIRYQYTYK